MEVSLDTLHTLCSQSRQEAVSRFDQTSRQLVSMLQVQNDILIATASKLHPERPESALDADVGEQNHYTNDKIPSNPEYPKGVNKELTALHVAHSLVVPNPPGRSEIKCPPALIGSVTTYAMRNRNACTWNCHSSARIRSPSFFDRLFGSLLIGYKGSFLLSSRRHEVDCRHQDFHSLLFIYFFPVWFLARTVQIVLNSDKMGDLTLAITTRRRVTDHNLMQSVTLNCSTGDVDAMRNLFRKRAVLPNDQFRGGETVLHASCLWIRASSRR